MQNSKQIQQLYPIYECSHEFDDQLSKFTKKRKFNEITNTEHEWVTFMTKKLKNNDFDISNLSTGLKIEQGTDYEYDHTILSRSNTTEFSLRAIEVVPHSRINGKIEIEPYYKILPYSKYASKIKDILGMNAETDFKRKNQKVPLSTEQTPDDDENMLIQYIQRLQLKNNQENNQLLQNQQNGRFISNTQRIYHNNHKCPQQQKDKQDDNKRYDMSDLRQMR